MCFQLKSSGVNRLCISSSLSQAYERRFPTCHLIPMFVASDIVNEETSEDGSTQKIERRCALDVDAPRLLKRVCCTSRFPAIEYHKYSFNAFLMTFNIVLRTIHFSTRLLQNVLANKSVNFCKGSLSVILFSVSVFHASCIYNTSSIAVYRLQA